MPGGNKLIAHLKDNTLVRNKKRWSQVKGRKNATETRRKVLVAGPF